MMNDTKRRRQWRVGSGIRNAADSRQTGGARDKEMKDQVRKKQSENKNKISPLGSSFPLRKKKLLNPDDLLFYVYKDLIRRAAASAALH